MKTRRLNFSFAAQLKTKFILKNTSKNFNTTKSLK